MVEKLKLQWFRDALSVMHQISEVHDAEATWGTLVQAKETLANKMIEWQARLGEIHSRNQEFEEQVAIAEQKLIAAQMDTSCAEALEGLKEEQALLLAREKQMETDLK
ncbi:hypothetical protein R1flu_009644 [Riccia fluitans]|uniref:Uncharacterized protein n=1 Tax=Riccia fluitans TaxID=41844 RepID=A0ABD1Z2Q0_9MARC